MKITFRTLNMLGLFLSIWSPSLLAMACPQGTYHVRSHPRSAYYRADGTFVKAAQVQEYCREKDAIYNIWISRLKDGLPNGWPQKNETATKWTEEQRERVLEALGELPEELLRTSLKGFYRLAKSIHYPNPSSRSGDMIVLYDSAFDKGRRLARILAHELAHQNYADLSGMDRSNYRQAVGWTDVELDRNMVIWKERKGGYVEEDGRIGPDEDYANNLEYFLFQPNVLKAKTLKAFDWMKKHFSDKFKIGKGAK